VLFTGTSELQIDAKQRLAIPAKYRNQWDPTRDGGAWYCVPWPTGRLIRLYTEGAFNRLSEQLASSIAPTDAQADFDASFFGYAERLEMDTAGRIALPKLHLQLTGLQGQVVVVGARTHLEVRDRDVWIAGHQQRFEALPDLARQAATGQRPAGA